MPFLSINNYEIPIKHDDWTEEEQEIGAEDARSAGSSVQFQRDTRAFKRRWRGSSTLLNGQEADAAELWLQGVCWHVGFERGLQSTNGLSPDTGYAGVITTTPKFGTYCAFGALGNTIARYRIPVRTRTNDWSISLWYRDATAGVYVHLCVVSRQGTVSRYINGTYAAATAGSTTVVDSPTTNAIRFTLVAIFPDGSSSSNFRVDDVVLFNWPLTTSQVTALATATRAFSEAPVLEASGDFLDEAGPVLVRGMVESEQYTLVQDPTLGWDDNQRPIQFALEEV